MNLPTVVNTVAAGLHQATYEETAIDAAHSGSDATVAGNAAVIAKLNRGNLDFLKNTKIGDTSATQWDDKTTTQPATLEDYGELFGASKDPSGLKDFMNAASQGNPYGDDLLSSSLDPSRPADPRIGGSQLGNQVRDFLASKGISVSYVYGVDGGAAAKVVSSKDQSTSGPDVATFSPAFQDTVDPSKYKNSVDALPSKDEDPQGAKQDQAADGESKPDGEVWSRVKAFFGAVATSILHSAGRGVGAVAAVPAEIALHSDEDTYNGVKGLVQQGQMGTTHQAAADQLRQIDKEEGRDPTRHLTADYKESPGGNVSPHDLQAFRKAGPIDPADPMHDSGRSEAQTHRLAEGVAIGIMSKINPKPYEGSAPSGPIVVPANPIADPIDSGEKPGTKIKPRKPDGPIGL